MAPSAYSRRIYIIAVAIVGILAAIAYPAYTSQMQQTRRAECTAGLMQLASAMERDFSRNQNQYRNIITAGLFAATCPVDGSGPATYNLSVNATTSTYTLSAAPISAAAQADDPCGTLTLTNQLQKGQASGKTVAECWR
ncbi:MAG: type IV pilin protein [Thiogranum sp.]